MLIWIYWYTLQQIDLETDIPWWYADPCIFIIKKWIWTLTKVLAYFPAFTCDCRVETWHNSICDSEPMESLREHVFPLKITDTVKTSLSQLLKMLYSLDDLTVHWIQGFGWPYTDWHKGQNGSKSPFCNPSGKQYGKFWSQRAKYLGEKRLFCLL